MPNGTEKNGNWKVAEKLAEMKGWRSNIVAIGSGVITVIGIILFYVFIYYPDVYAKIDIVKEVRIEIRDVKSEFLAVVKEINTTMTSMDNKLDDAINLGKVNETKIGALEKTQDRHEITIEKIREKFPGI